MDYQKLITLSYSSDKAYKELYSTRINNECANILDFEISGNKAFYLTNQELLMLITKITGLDKTLEIKIKSLPQIAVDQYTKQTLIDEIKQTNDIENVYSTKKQIKSTFEKITKNDNKGRFNGLIRKYLVLQNGTAISLKTCEDVRKLYDEIVLKEVVEEDASNAPDGLLFRKESVSVYSDSGKEIHTGAFPERKIISLLSSALSILNDENVNYLISSAVFHYLFAYIHPFYDGNGRTDRFISSYYISKNLNYLVSYRFSYVIKKHKSQYYKMFKETNDPRNKGDLTPFIIQFLEFILEVEKDLIEEIDKRNDLLEYYTQKLKMRKLSELEESVGNKLLLSALFGSEGISASDLCAVTEKSFVTVKKALGFFEKNKMLICERSGNSKLYQIDLDTL